MLGHNLVFVMLKSDQYTDHEAMPRRAPWACAHVRVHECICHLGILFKSLEWNKCPAKRYGAITGQLHDKNIRMFTHCVLLLVYFSRLHLLSVHWVGTARANSIALEYHVIAFAINVNMG